MLGGNGSLIRLLLGGSGKSAVIAAGCVMFHLNVLSLDRYAIIIT
jgi:hypothetical protein